jgi:glycosyltransferase involved in cell wall biosynthesis
LGVDGISFAGRQDPAEMAALYDRAHIFLNASTIDNQPVSILEAFSAGLPVVSTPTGDIKNMVVSGKTGVLVPAGDPTALAGAMTQLLRDPAHARSMARRAREEVEAYTWPLVRDAWMAVYRQPDSVPIGDDRARVGVSQPPDRSQRASMRTRLASSVSRSRTASSSP